MRVQNVDEIDPCSHFLLGCVLAIISPWLGFFPERLAAEKTDALKIAKERENEVEPQTAKEWIKELVIICTYIIEVAKCLQFGPTKSDYINRMITITGGFKKDL